MTYRSERFPAGELKGLERAWGVIDNLEALGLPVAAEVMAGSSYRRQLAPSTVTKIGGEVNYLLQAVLSVPKRDDGRRITLPYFIDEARRILGEVDAPGEITLDEGGINGLDHALQSFPFGSTGRTEDDLVTVYPPWVESKWTEAGKRCMFYCGIEPPQPKALMEDYPTRWDERLMRRGIIVFEPTPSDLKTY